MSAHTNLVSLLRRREEKPIWPPSRSPEGPISFSSTAGIELVTNSRVNGVTPSGVQVYNTKTEEMVEIPYGACVWATGIKMNPLVKQIQQVLPEGTQNHFRCLVTDSYLRVKGSEGSIYCLGDAGTVAEDKVLFLVPCRDGGSSLTSQDPLTS